MATTENNGLLTYKDEAGNLHLLYPVTKAELVDGLDTALMERFTDEEKIKLAGIAENANNYVLPSQGVGTEHLADSSVTTAKIADGAVTAAKLASDAKSKGIAVTLAAASWSSNTQTVSVSGVTATNNVIVAAAPGSRTAWNDAEVYCSAQGAGTLTFTCGTTPTEDLTANVIILV